MKHTLNCDINTQVGGNHEHCNCPCHKRIYGKWAGNPNGQPEDVTLCIEEIWGTDSAGTVPADCTASNTPA